MKAKVTKRWYVISRACNVAGSFEKAIYRGQRLGYVFKSGKEARKAFNLDRCNYDVISYDENDNEIGRMCYRNGRVDSFGRLMKKEVYYGELDD